MAWRTGLADKNLMWMLTWLTPAARVWLEFTVLPDPVENVPEVSVNICV
jgi:hypothetical protein